MIRPRWQKVITDLWKNKSRSLLVIASIMVGLFAIGIISKVYLSINQDMEYGFRAIQPANVQVRTSLIDQNIVDWVEHLDEIQRVEPVRRANLQIETPEGSWNAIDIISKDFNDQVINQVELLEGEWPPKEHQIVLSDHKRENVGAQIGEVITIKNAQGDLYDLLVVGIVKDQSIGTSGGTGGFFNSSIQGYVDPDCLEWLHIDQPERYNELHILINGNPEDSLARNHAEAQVRLILEENNVTILNSSTRDPGHHPNQDLVDAIMGILLLLGFLIVFLSGFLITNTLQSILDQQIQQVGILKTIGAKRSQITSIYMALIFIYGVLAFAIAYPLADIASGLLVQFLASKINFKYGGSQFEPLVLIIQMILALVVPQAAAVIPILQGTKISVQEALSGIRQNNEVGKGWIDRVLTRFRSISRPISIALRNVFRRKGRVTLTLITLTLGGAVFISVFNVRISLSNYIDQLSQYFLADVNLSLARAYRIDYIDHLLSNVPEIGHAEAWGGVRSWVVLPDGALGDNVNLIAPPANSQLIDPILISGRWLVPEDQNAIVLNDQFQVLFPELIVGDTLTLRIGDRDTEWVVVGYFQLAGKIGGLAAYVNLDYLATQPGIVSGQASTYRIVAHRSLTTEEQIELVKQVQDIMDANHIQISELATGSKINDSSAASFAILTNFLLVLAILTALVGSIGLAGTMSMNVMDRTREIGVMRSIGASNPILMQMVLIEGLVIGWISWIFGAILSFPISQFMSDMITRALFGAPSTYGMTMSGFVIWFGVVSGLSILASILPARNAASLTIREVLAYE